jgi:hypothetical protein
MCVQIQISPNPTVNALCCLGLRTLFADFCAVCETLHVCFKFVNNFICFQAEKVKRLICLLLADSEIATKLYLCVYQLGILDRELGHRVDVQRLEFNRDKLLHVTQVLREHVK